MPTFPKGKKQSPKSNLVGNSDGRYAPMGNTSSVIDGETVSRAQSVVSDTAKVQRKYEIPAHLVTKWNGIHLDLLDIAF